jgi:trigger factor
MQVKKEQLSPTKVKLTAIAEQSMMDEIKHEVLTHLAKDHVKIQGFRAGKAPLNLVEKNVDQQLLQSEFLEQAVNRMYVTALQHNRVRPVSQPEISITKFVPFTTLELTAEVETVGDVKLPDYKAIKLVKPKVSVTAKDVDKVVHDLQTRLSERKEVERAAKSGDEAVIDFAGTDAKTKEAIAGADGKDYPLVLGSANFIPGFEDKVIGMKPGETQSFELTFPKDYGTTALQNRKVTFKVTIKKLNEMTEPKADDDFAGKVGPFKTVAELKADIKKQLTAEKINELDRQYESDLLEQIAAKTTVAIPAVLIDEEVERQEQGERQNLTYRGQTWQEHLKEEGVTEEEHRERQRPAAELRVKAGLALSEIAEQEGIKVTPEETEIRLQLMKGQYQDPTMQAEFDKPETRREVSNRLLSEKTIAKLTTYASK